MTRSCAAVIGSPVRHSLSPVMFNAQFAHDAREWSYEAVEVTEDSLPSFVNRVRESEFGAFSVTMPLKEAILRHVDELDDTVRALQATNSVRVVEGRLFAFNTDGDGCCDAIQTIGGAHFDGATAIVFGSGGTSRSVSLALLRRGAKVRIVNRSVRNAERAVEMLRKVDPSFEVHVGVSDDIPAAHIVVNTTPVGMGDGDSGDAVVADLSELKEGTVALDAVYQPLDTAFLRAARTRGARTVDGLWMLVYQAARQHRLWFGADASVGVMREAAERELSIRHK